MINRLEGQMFLKVLGVIKPNSLYFFNKNDFMWLTIKFIYTFVSYGYSWFTIVDIISRMDHPPNWCLGCCGTGNAYPSRTASITFVFSWLFFCFVYHFIWTVCSFCILIAVLVAIYIDYYSSLVKRVDCLES